jgi:hypothetical protein
MTLRPNLLADLYVPEPIRGKLEVPGSAFDFPEVPIEINHVADKAAIIATTSVLDAETFVELISSGQNLQFVLISHNGPALTLPIPNEPEVIKVLQEALD